jgi:hypothetical protein
MRQQQEVHRLENSDKEAAFVFNDNFESRTKYKGSDDKLDFGSALYGNNLFVMHNHPRNSSYSCLIEKIVK